MMSPIALKAASVNDQILEQELKQVKIKTTTQRVGEQLAEILDELELNRIDGTEVKSLRDIRGMIGFLTENEMSQIVGMLQSARGETTGPESRQQIANAFSGQKSVIIQLHQIMLEYQNQQKLYELARQLKGLAEDQTVNMRQGVWLANLTENKNYQSFNEFQKNSLRIQHIEQSTIRDRVTDVLKELAELEKTIEDGPNADRPKAAMDVVREGILDKSLQTAALDLEESNLRLLSAIGQEKQARDQLREVARLLLMTKDQTELLRQALRELDTAIERQKEVIQETKDVKEKDDASNAEQSQAEVVDAVDLIQKDIDSIAPLASDVLSEASDDMQEARSELRDNNKPEERRDNALPKENSALNQLQMARRELMDQLAQAMENPEVAKSNLEELNDMQKELQELIQAQENLKTETAETKMEDLPTKAPAQGSMRDQATEIQKNASSLSPTAAQDMGEAASQMKTAQNSLASAQNNPQAQQAAIDAMRRASEQLSQDIAQLEEAQEELDNLNELLAKLKKVIKDQQDVQLLTAKESTRDDAGTFTELGESQADLGQRTDQLKEEAAQDTPSAANHLHDASQHMAEAKKQLDVPKAMAAQNQQSEALIDLQLARKEIEDRMDELQSMLGQPPSGAALADAAQLIEQAQKDVNAALAQLQQSPPGLMESLLQQQQQIADDLGLINEEDSPTSPTGQAQQSAEQAAVQLSQSNVPAAIDFMQEAMNAMNQAVQSAAQEPTDRQAKKVSQGVPSLDEQQQNIKTIAEALLKAQEEAPAEAMAQAAQSLQHAGETISPITAGELGQLPVPAQMALQAAQDSLASGTAKAFAEEGVPAQIDASSASQALAQAQAALAMAQAGMGSQMAQGQGQGQGQGKGQGQGQGKGQGQGQGQGQGKGQGKGQGQGPPSEQGNGRQGNWAGSGGGEGNRRGTKGFGTFTGLPQRDRAAILQSQGEKYPQEYGPLVEQYLKNLSDQSNR